MTRHPRRLRAFAVSAGVVAALLSGAVACDRGARPAPAVASHYSGENCDAFVDGTSQASFADEKGTRLSAVEVGSGPVGFVLAHQDPGDVCQWLPYARLLARHPGYHVLCLDFAGYGNSDFPADGDTRDRQLAAAVAYLRTTGVTKVILMGASMGGNAVLVAATKIAPPVSGVVSFSAPAVYKGLDAQAAVAGLAVPVLYLAGSSDSGGEFAADAQDLYDATPAGVDRTLVIVSSAAHGANLLSPVDAGYSHTRAAVDAFLARYA